MEMREARSRAAKYRTSMYVMAPLTHMLVAVNRLGRSDGVSVLGDIFLQHDGIAALGHYRSREHPDRLPWGRQGMRRWSACQAFVDDFEVCNTVEIRGVHRVAVHGGAIERWQVDRGCYRVRGDAPHGVGDHQPFGFAYGPNETNEFLKCQVNV